MTEENGKIKRLRNLPQYKNLSEEEFQTKLKEREKLSELDINDLFTDKKEREKAKDLINKYLEEYKIETVADKNLLKQLVYLEIFHLRLQESANLFSKENKNIPLQLVNALHANLNQILILKDQLGLSKDKSLEQSDTFRALELLKKKFKVWKEENQASRTLVCPHCGRLIMLRIKTDAWEAQKHSFFKDRILGNSHLIRLYKENKLTKQDLALIFETSTDYVDWLVNKWKLNEDTTITEKT